MKDILLYKHPASYAREHDELTEYRASNRANMACKDAIEDAIRNHYYDNCLGTEAVKQVVEQFGYDRLFYVLANTVQQKDWDGRISQDNKAWARTVPVCANPDGFGLDRNCYFAVNSHSGLIDLFLKQARRAFAQDQQKTSIREKLQEAPVVTSPKNSAKLKAQER